MRKTVEGGGVVMLVVLFWITYAALNGPQQLPLRVPTHFDISGRPNAWGSPQVLWLLPVIGTCLYLLMTALATIRFRNYNLPVRVTDRNLPFIHEKTGEMIAWIKLEVLSLFVYIQWSIIEGARAGEFHLPPMMIPVFLVLIFATVGWYLAIIIKGARALSESPDSADRAKY